MSEQERKARRQRLDALRGAGVDPFPARVKARTPLAQVRSEFGEKSAEELEAEPARRAVAGRVMAIRAFGKLQFWSLREDGVSLQVSINKREVDASLFTLAKNVDVGDFVWAEGPVWRTRTGELSVGAHSRIGHHRAVYTFEVKFGDNNCICNR